MSQGKRTDLRNQDFLVLRQSTNKNVVKVATPHTFQIGLDDDEFKSSLIVKGSAQLDGRLVDKQGSAYVKGSGSVTVTEDVTGGITISATVGAGAVLSGNASGGITSFTYDGSSTATVEIDLFTSTGLELTSFGLAINPTQASELSATPASDDYLLIHDTSDTGNSRDVKKISVNNLMSAAATMTSLGNPITFRDGLTNTPYNNSAPKTIDVTLATNSGLGISGGTGTGGGLLVDPNSAVATTTLQGSADYVLIYDATASATRKILAQKFADLGSSYSLSSGTGLTYSVGSAYNAAADSTLSVDTSVIPTLAGNNTLTGDNTFSGASTFSGTTTFGTIIAKHDEASAGVPYLVGGTNITVSYNTPTTGQITLAASSTSPGALTNGPGIGTLSYNGSTAKTVSVDMTNLSTVAANRNHFVVTADNTSLSSVSKTSIASLADIVDRTAIMAEGAGIDISFAGNSNPATIAVQYDNDTIGLDGSGDIEVKKVPNSLTNGPGIKSLSFDGSSAVTVETNLKAGTNITLTTNSDKSITIDAAGGSGAVTGSISNITQANPGVVTTVLNHNLSEGQGVTLTSVVGMTEVNGNEYYADVLSGNTFAMYSDNTLSTSVNTTGFTAYASDGKFTGDAGGGTAIDFVSGSTTVNSIDKVDVTNLAILNSYGSGDIALTGTIGTAEDGSYSDGLFTDFTTQTPVGTAVDRFNEVLKGLAPSAAPNLDDMSCSDSGTTANLSFGSTQSISGYTNVLPSTLTPASSLSNVDINGSYASTTSGNDVRVACLNGATVIDGTLNADISPDSPNFAVGAFGNGDQGTLKLFVNNNSTEKHSVDLSSFGSGNSLNSNGSGFNLSAVTNGAFADGSSFSTFKHRTGTYTIATTDQANGWNYARVVHTIGSTSTTCNYVEWVNDSNSNALSADNSVFDGLSMTGTKQLSGVTYHTAGTAQYRVRALIAYRNVYSSNNITFTGTNCSTPAQAFPTINHGAGEDESKLLQITGSATINTDPLLNQSISVSVNVPAPLKSSLSSAGSQSISGILLYNLSDTATTTSEPFRGESYRRASGSYDNQAAVTDSGAVWNSSTSLLSLNGLLFYNSALRAPRQGAVSGDFRNTSDGGSIANGPSSNVDYSTISSGLRTFYRYFQNTSGGSKTDFILTLNGSGTIVEQGTSLSTSNVHVLVKLPETSSSFSTGWMDLAKAFATGQVSDGDGCLNGSLDSSLNASNAGTFGTQSAGANEYIVVKIEADASWTGNISQMSISWS